MDVLTQNFRFSISNKKYGFLFFKVEYGNRFLFNRCINVSTYIKVEQDHSIQTVINNEFMLLHKFSSVFGIILIRTSASHLDHVFDLANEIYHV